MLKGILSAAAAKRIELPELAGAEVEYTWLRPGMAGEIYYDGELIAKCVEIGPNGIIPVQERRKNAGRLLNGREWNEMPEVNR